MRPLLILLLSIVFGYCSIQAAVHTVTTNTGTSIGSLPYTVSIANPGDTIIFSPSLNGTTIQVTSRISVRKSLIIMGPGPNLLSVELVGDSSTNVFDIFSGHDFWLSGLKFVWSGILFSTNDVYVDNIEVDGFDGIPLAVQVSDYFELTNSTFTNITGSFAVSAGARLNILDNVSVLDGTDGGMNIFGDSLIMSNCLIKGNGSPNVSASGALIIGAISYTELINTVVDSNFSSSYTAGIGARDNYGTPTPNQMLIMSGCTVSRNETGNTVGGLNMVNIENFMITDCAFDQNVAANSGGGVQVYFSNGSFEGCSITNNRSRDAGGMNIGNSDVYINNSTFSGNRVEIDPNISLTLVRGGALSVESGCVATVESNVLIENSTITNNHSEVFGGGIYNCVDRITLLNSIVAGNTADSLWNDIYQQMSLDTLVLIGYNIIGDLTGARHVNNTPTDITGTLNNPIDPGLAPLANNGGNTLTHALMCGSPAIDSGNDTLTQPDQRGLPRFGIPDRGAFELQRISSVITFDLGDIEICQGDSFEGYTTSGTYIDTFVTPDCDSIRILTLIVNTSTTSTLNVTSCNSYTSPSSNYVWTTSGTYLDTIPGGNGCDSVMTVNLTVNQTSFSTINPTICNSYTSPSGHYTWNTSGTYSDTMISSVGCDSIITINLVVNHASSSTFNETACNSYTSPSGNYTWTSSGTYTDTVPNFTGCDSLITVNLTILSFPVSNLLDDEYLGCSLGCEWLTANTQGNVNYLWSTGATNRQIQVCPTSTSNYYLTVTDNATGCEVMDTAVVTVSDTVCGPGLTRVCRRRNRSSLIEDCVDSTQLAVYLSQGATLGCCNTGPGVIPGPPPGIPPVNRSFRSMQSFISPNPFGNKTVLGFNSSEPAHITVEIFNSIGQRIAILFSKDVEEEQPYQTEFYRGSLPAGIYIGRITSSNGEVNYHKMFITD